ncbi:MAG: glycoside hydrolase 43 family protein [Devosia sp.]|uniref:glycoside hydrolase family 43 protein n=1 Tax=Devosia sp. TaxID=1871048 RepID=UPI0024C6B5FC|nr:glycoside hydrolase 43 family protein [Devosia sp.]UYN98550.1 MAG: glycoside hydrolase 43 family protein [Devosia sp.]
MTVSNRTWTADNGDGTFTNPLFYEEFSDPDIIRVGSDFYMTGTTMHTMPGLPVLHSTDLVNWSLLCYAFDTLDLGPQFRLEGGEIYGQGIWAPCIRYKNGTFYIFSNVNGQKTQIFTATNPAGPWTRSEAEYNYHDLTVFFDDDGRSYVVWGYRNLKIAELDETLHRVLPGTQRDLTPADSLMGEGAHFYKVDGKYLITSAWFSGKMRMPCARADHIDGPWEINPAISIDEDFGMMEGYKIKGAGIPFTLEPPFELVPPNPAANGRLNLHQGGIVDTAQGEWWAWSMMDYNSLGRLTCLSPVTWQDGWPYFGLPGNLGRTPRTWTKPKTDRPSPIALPWPHRSDDFDSAGLNPLWQWNHVPVAGKWSLTERAGHLRLHTLPAENFWWARNSLTQRAIGPISIATAKLDASGLAEGDVAGLALLGMPWRWIGLARTASGFELRMADYQSGQTLSMPANSPHVWLRADCNYLSEVTQFLWSADGQTFAPLGDAMIMVYQLKTFQGIRYALFAYNELGSAGGYADFDSLVVDEPHPRGLMQPIPDGQNGTLVLANMPTTGFTSDLRTVHAGPPMDLRVEAIDHGRVVLHHADGPMSVTQGGVVTVGGIAGMATHWQWIETPTGEVVLMSLATNRFLRVHPDGSVRADNPGPTPDGLDGTRFRFVGAGA